MHTKIIELLEQLANETTDPRIRKMCEYESRMMRMEADKVLEQARQQISLFEIGKHLDHAEKMKMEYRELAKDTNDDDLLKCVYRGIYLRWVKTYNDLAVLYRNVAREK